MSSIKLLILPLLCSIVIQIRLITLIIFNLLMKIFPHLTTPYHLVKYLGRCVQTFFSIISGDYSLVNLADADFNVGITAHQLFKQNNINKDYNNPDIYDLFHIYLSKISYESSDQIKYQCMNWGFDRQSIKILTYIPSEDLKKYSYSTQATAIHYDESNTIIIAFGGTELMDLLQWLTDGSTSFIEIKNVFNDVYNNNEPIRVHAGFYSALGLHEANILQTIDSTKVTEKSPLFIQLLNFINKFDTDDNKCKISITGHSLGGALASLFGFVLLVHGYESSISSVYTYGQPLIGNRRYAEILNDKLGNRIHRWVNHSDIVTRIPAMESPSIPLYYPRTLYSDALKVAVNNDRTESNSYYYHSGFRFKINHEENLERQKLIDEGPIFAYQDGFHLFNFIYSIKNVIHSLFNITPTRSFLWLIFPSGMNDHFPGDYGRKIKKIITNNE